MPGRSIETAEFALRQHPDSEGLPATLIAVEAGEEQHFVTLAARRAVAIAARSAAVKICLDIGAGNF